MSYGGQQGGGRFQPKPRPVLEPEHELRPVAEAVIREKAKLRDHASIGDTVSTENIIVEGTSVPVPYAALVISHQLGIPHDHPNLPPMVKHKTTYQANEYALLYASAGDIKWEKDETFKYIPGYTRYVINKDGHIKNAYNGQTVTPNIYSGFTKLVPDGRANRVTGVDGLTIKALCQLPLPSDFIDFGFRSYSHRLDVNPEKQAIEWMPLPMVSARSNVDGAIHKFKNVHQMIRNNLKDFNQMVEANKAARNLTDSNVIIAGEYSVKCGDINDISQFGPANAGPADSSSQDIPF